MQGADAAEAYYQSVRSMLIDDEMPVEQLTITRKIAIVLRIILVDLGIGKARRSASATGIKNKLAQTFQNW